MTNPTAALTPAALIARASDNWGCCGIRVETRTASRRNETHVLGRAYRLVTVTRITLAGMTEGGQDVVLTVNEDGTLTTRQHDGEQPITLKRAAAIVEARIGLYIARAAYLAAERLSEELARAATHSDDLGVEEAA